MPANFSIIIERNFEHFLIRRWVNLLLEILVIAAIFGIIVWNPTAYRSEQSFDEKTSTRWKLTPLLNIEDTSMINHTIKYINYISGNDFITDLVTKAAVRLNLIATSTSNERLMETGFDEGKVLCGIVFDNEKKLPTELSLRLRFPNLLRSIKSKVNQNNYWQYRITGDIRDEEAVDKKLFSGIFMREGFLQIQHAIFQEWLSKISQKTKPYNIAVGWFIFPKDHKKRLSLDESGLNTFLYHFAFCYAFCNTVYVYARTCQKNLLPHLWRYGYRYSTNWWGDGIITILKLFILDLVIICFLYISKSSDPLVISFQHVHFGYFVLFLLIYNIQFITCAIFYALIMQHGKRSVLLALTIWLATYGCFAILLRGNFYINTVVLIVLISHFNNVLPFGMTYLYNRFEYSSNEYWYLLGCMMANIFLYSFLSSCIQYSKPGRYMHVNKFNFLYWRSIFCANRTPFYRKEKKRTALFEKPLDMKNYEYGPFGVEGFVKLKRVCTSYKLFPDRNHLKDISLTMFKGEITVVWGHHSAGKTSLICILAGWQMPSSGSIKFGDYDLHKDWNKARRLCDVCMPNNALYDYLTVRRTLVHFVSIKQETDDPSYVSAEVRKWLEVLKPSILNGRQLVRELNYDQKRLLCLCIVLSCDTKIILLDEPTQKMRLQEKQFYWSILRAERTNRVILIATCSLDEANYIGDRVAFLDNGKLLAYGTQFYLKTSFSNTYYYLVINKNTEAPIIPITRFVLSYIPDITMEHGLSSRVVYKVPADKRPLFQRLLLNLEKSSNELGIQKIQMLTSGLNEVALLLTKDKVKPFDKPADKYFLSRRIDEEIAYKMQVNAMILKKTVNQMPHLWPVSVVLISIIITSIIGKLSEVLPTPPTRHNATYFGLNNTAEELTDLPPWNVDKCNFIRVKDLKTDKHVKLIKSNTYFFYKDAYVCHKENSFEQYLTVTIPPPKNHLAAIEFSSEYNWTIWLNKRELEAGPAILNLAHNLILKSIFHDNNKYIPKISNDPFMMALIFKVWLLIKNNCHLRLPIIAGLMMPFILSCFILEIIEERHSHMWAIQRIAGLHLGIYWIVTYIWDWLTFILFAFLFIIVQLIVTIEGVGYQEKLWMYVVIIVYGLPALVWSYIVSMFMQKSKTNGFLINLIFSFTTGIVLFNSIYEIYSFIEPDMLDYFFVLMPHVAMLDAISSLYFYAKLRTYCEEMCNTYYCTKDVETMCSVNDGCCLLKNERKILILALTSLIINAAISWLCMYIISMLRADITMFTTKDLKKYRTACFPYDDTEVKELREYVSNTIPPEIYRKKYIVDQLEYELPKKPGSIHTISFEAQKGECVSIYGNRRSGTSRLARLLAGINPIRFGAIYVEGVHMQSELMRAWNYIGYCPPNRGLYNNFTARELMKFLNMIAGTPTKYGNEMVRATFQLLNMRDYVHKKCGHLSVEKQRTVNIATAIVIFKSVLILDEPTIGMPLSTTQEVWNALQYLLHLGRTIIFTSSAVIECRTLAHKMLIYERGEMYAYGGFYYLLLRYTKGIYLQIKLNRDGDSLKEIQANFHKDVENLYRFVTYLHASSELCSRVDNCLTFYMPIENFQYSFLFGSLEKNKGRLNISDYTINQGTIEEIMYTLLTARKRRLHLN